MRSAGTCGPGCPTRDVEELLVERGVTVDHVTVYLWVQRFTPEFIEAARLCRHAPGDRWFVDETYVKVGGRWAYLYRAVDQQGQVIDVLLSVRHDLAAARRFFTRALRAGTIPAEVTTDRARVYPRVLDELIPTALPTVERLRITSRVSQAASIGTWPSQGPSGRMDGCIPPASLRIGGAATRARRSTGEGAAGWRRGFGLSRS